MNLNIYLLNNNLVLFVTLGNNIIYEWISNTAGELHPVIAEVFGIQSL